MFNFCDQSLARVHCGPWHVRRPAVSWVLPLIKFLLLILLVVALIGNVILIEAKLVEGIPFLSVDVDDLRALVLYNGVSA